MNWRGCEIEHVDPRLGRGRVLTDYADAETHLKGSLLVEFFNTSQTRRWVDSRNCTLVSGCGR